MVRKIIYKEKSLIGGMMYIKELAPKQNKKGYDIRYGLFICPYCGLEFRCHISYIVSGHTKSCGCIKRLGKHKLRDHPLYYVWHSMKSRCLNPKSTSYHNYGGRGIKVCKEWIDSFVSFYDWAIKTYDKGLELDRIDNNGDYTPDNCRFVSGIVQSRNTRIQKNNTSGYRGVSFIKSRGKWRSRVKINKKYIFLGDYKLLTDAVKARDDYILKNNLIGFSLSTGKRLD